MRIVFSADIETNGLAAGINSMLSLGVVAFDMNEGQIVSRFKINLQPLPDLKVDESTMQWWTNFPEAYHRATVGAVEPSAAVFERFERWVHFWVGPEAKPVLACWKPGFDAAFIRYYLHRFLGRDVFGRAGSGLDIKSVTAAALGQRFQETQIGTVPAELRGKTEEHNHDALDDAIEQAYVLYNAEKKLGTQIV